MIENFYNIFCCYCYCCHHLMIILVRSGARNVEVSSNSMTAVITAYTVILSLDTLHRRELYYITVCR